MPHALAACITSHAAPRWRVGRMSLVPEPLRVAMFATTAVRKDPKGLEYVALGGLPPLLLRRRCPPHERHKNPSDPCAALGLQGQGTLYFSASLTPLGNQTRNLIELWLPHAQPGGRARRPEPPERRERQGVPVRGGRDVIQGRQRHRVAGRAAGLQDGRLRPPGVGEWGMGK